MKIGISLSVNRGEKTTPIAVAAPVNTVAPAISGTLLEGETLSVSTGTWDNAPTGYGYQWTRNGGDIAGATSSTYDLVVGTDGGTTIGCDVTATNAGGSTEQAATGGGVVDYGAANQTATFGALTLSGAGAYQIVDSNGDALTTVTDLGTGTASGSTYTLTSGGLVTPSSNGSLSAQDGNTIIISSDQGTCTVTLDVVANRYDFKTGEQLEAAVAAAVTASASTDYTMVARPGTISRSSGTVTGIFGKVFSGTLTEPNTGATKATYSKTATASVSGGSFTITCDTDLGAVWDHKLRILGSTPFVVEKQDFQYLPTTDLSQLQIEANGTYTTKPKGIVRNCRFGGYAASPVVSTDWPICIDMPISNTVIIEDNEFEGYYIGLQGSVVDFLAVRRNAMHNQAADGMRAGFGCTPAGLTGDEWTFHASGNTIWDLNLDAEWAALHSDGIQLTSSGTTADGNVLITDNYIYLDDDDATTGGRYSQGVFAGSGAGVGEVMNGAIWGNMVAVTNPNALTLFDAGTSLEAHNNTLIRLENLSDQPFSAAGATLYVAAAGLRPFVWDNIQTEITDYGAGYIASGNVNVLHDSNTASAGHYAEVFDGTFTWNATRSAQTFSVTTTSAAALRASLDATFTPTTGEIADNKGHLSYNATKPTAAPAAFASGDWSLADNESGAALAVSITSLPADTGGSSITDIEYSVDAGTWHSSGGTTSFVADQDLTNGVESDLQIRPVNAIGAGPASDTKAATPTGTTITYARTNAADPTFFFEAVDYGSGITKITVEMLIRLNSTPGSLDYFWYMWGDGFNFQSQDGSSTRLTVEDANGNKKFNAYVHPTASIPVSQWTEITGVFDFTAGTYGQWTLTIDGTTYGPIDAANTAGTQSFPTVNRMSLLAKATDLDHLPGGTDFQLLRITANNTVVKEILATDGAAAINARSDKQNGDVTVATE